MREFRVDFLCGVVRFIYVFPFGVIETEGFMESFRMTVEFSPFVSVTRAC